MMKTTKTKRLLSLIMAICLVFGSASALPENALTESASVTASAQGEEGGEAIVEGDFEIRLMTDNKAAVTRYLGSDTNVTIPETIAGYTVTMIDDGAFGGFDTLQSVTLPDSVINIAHDAFSFCENLASVTLSSELQSIDRNAFSDCPKLTSIALPGKLESIGSEAFMRTGLTSVSLPDSVTFMDERVFCECDSLQAVTIGKNLGSVSRSAFRDCRALETVTLSEGLTEISAEAFSRCMKLSTAALPSTLRVIGDCAFEGTALAAVTFPSQLEEIGEGAFVYCDSLTTVSVPDSVTYIGPRAFEGCYSLTAATLGKGCEIINDGLFQDCENLTTVTIPDSCIWIGRYAFRNCRSLKDLPLHDAIASIHDEAFARTGVEAVTLPKGLVLLDDRAFCDCDKLTSVTFNDELLAVGRDPFFSTPYMFAKMQSGDDVIENGVLLYASNKKNYTVADTVKVIAGGAFNGKSDLETVTISENVISIGDNAFMYCPKLTTLNIPKNVALVGKAPVFECSSFTAYSVDAENKGYTAVDGVLYSKTEKTLISCPTAKQDPTIEAGVEAINPQAFYGCTGLKKLDIPDSVQDIGSEAFKGCTGLTEVNIPSSVENLGESVFAECTGIEKASIAGSVTQIPTNAFYDCTKLASVELNEGTETIGDVAFANCPALSSIILPASVNELRYAAIGYMMQDVPGGPPHETPIEGGFMIYGYDTFGVGRWYAEDRDGIGYTALAEKRRLAGKTRYQTSASISNELYEENDMVFVTSGEEFADALAAAPAAAMADVPILLMPKNQPNQDILDEIQRLGAREVYIIGGEGAVSKQVEQAILGLGCVEKTTRIEGKNRFATAAKIAETMLLSNGGQAPENLFFVINDNFADALSISSVAGATESPILYVRKTGDIDQYTKAYLDKVKGKIKNAYIIGGNGVISDQMQATIDSYLGIKTERLAGPNRYDTNLEILKKFAGAGEGKVLNSETVTFATGNNFPDALSGAVAAAIGRAPMVLVNEKLKNAELSEKQCEVINAQKPKDAEFFKVVAFGGTGVVPEAILDQASNLIRMPIVPIQKNDQQEPT